MAKRLRRVVPSTDTVAPTPERLQRGDLASVATRDDAGWPIRRYNVIDIITRLTRNGLIDGPWADAVARFRQDYRTAHFQPLGVRDLLRQASSKGEGPVSDRIEEARDRVARAIARLGGLASPPGSIAWDVIGAEMSLNQWCERQRQLGRSFRYDMAAGLLIAAASGLAAHYARPVRR